MSVSAYSSFGVSLIDGASSSFGGAAVFALNVLYFVIILVSVCENELINKHDIQLFDTN